MKKLLTPSITILNTYTSTFQKKLTPLPEISIQHHIFCFEEYSFHWLLHTYYHILSVSEFNYSQDK